MEQLQQDAFLLAYHTFRETVDFAKKGLLPDLNELVLCLIMGVPEVPADNDEDPDAPLAAIAQRVAILKAVFVEVNSDMPDAFLDRGLALYGEAGRMAVKMWEHQAP